MWAGPAGLLEKARRLLEAGGALQGDDARKQQVPPHPMAFLSPTTFVPPHPVHLYTLPTSHSLLLGASTRAAPACTTRPCRPCSFTPAVPPSLPLFLSPSVFSPPHCWSLSLPLSPSPSLPPMSVRGVPAARVTGRQIPAGHRVGGGSPSRRGGCPGAPQVHFSESPRLPQSFLHPSV